MKEFQFNIDQKITIWERQICYREAESLEEAKQNIIDEFKEKGFIDDSDYETDFLYETAQRMVKEDNGGLPILEIMYEGKPFYAE